MRYLCSIRRVAQLGRPRTAYETNVQKRRSVAERLQQLFRGCWFAFAGIPASYLEAICFDTDWYVSVYPEVLESPLSPLTHFLVFGFLEKRSPNPERAFKETMDLEGDWRRFAQQLVRFNETLINIPSAESDNCTNQYSIVIPVYKGYEETRACIASVISSASMNPLMAEIIVVNDCSPDEEICNYLSELNSSGKIRLITTPKNLGFPGAVNLALEQTRDDVILLNSDTRVFENWAERLRVHASTFSRVGTITASSNNATICSVLDLSEDSNEISDSDVQMLDAFASKLVADQANLEDFRPICTAVGFCVYVKRSFLDAVGVFDETTFGKGYGEEVDLCLRGLIQGWIHLQALNVIVWHEGGVSFSSQRLDRTMRAQEIIDSRYPFFPSLHQALGSRYPSIDWFLKLLALELNTLNSETRIFFTHSRGGGTHRAVLERIQHSISAGHHAILIQLEDLQDSHFELHVPDGRVISLNTRREQTVSALTSFVSNLSHQEIEVHHYVGGELLFEQIMRECKLKYSLFLHDYSYICPQITLTDFDGRYCGEPEERECDKCMEERPVALALGIASFRERQGKVLKAAQRVVAPSLDTANRYLRYFEDVEIQVEPHQQLIKGFEVRVFEDRKSDLSKTIRRVVHIGAMSEVKGRSRFKRLIEISRALDLPLRFANIGPINSRDSGLIPATGRYEGDDLKFYVDQFQPNVALFLSDAPETYSYTLTEAMELGLHIVAPRWGAFPERLVDYPSYVLFDRKIDDSGILEILLRPIED
jgi:O-antigen biosynthesis protein